MEIPINDQFRIVSDKYNWKFQKLEVVKEGKNKGKTKWRSWGYWGTLDALCAALPNILLRRDVGDVESIKAVVAGLCTSLEDMRDLVRQAGEWGNLRDRA